MATLNSQNTAAVANRGIKFSVNAADKIAALLSEENNSKLNLHVFVTGGGCSGLEYGFTFTDDAIAPEDQVIEQFCSDGKTNVKLVIDPMSYQYLKNAEIDYVQGIQGEQFVIRNPNAKTTCGCGSSFSVEDDE